VRAAEFCRACGSESELVDKAAAIARRWLRGLGFARSLANSARPTTFPGAARARARWLLFVLARAKQIKRDD